MLNLVQNFLTQYRINQGDYTAAAGYTVSIVFTGPKTITIPAVSDGSNYLFNLEIDTAGLYRYTIFAENLDGRVLIESNRADVQPDATLISPGTDIRTHQERLLEAIEAVLEKRATTDQQSYSIAGRSITRIPISELLQLRDKYKAEVRDIQKKSPRNILVKFGNR